MSFTTNDLFLGAYLLRGGAKVQHVERRGRKIVFTFNGENSERLYREYFASKEMLELKSCYNHLRGLVYHLLSNRNDNAEIIDKGGGD